MRDEGQRLLKNLNWWLEFFRWAGAFILVSGVVGAAISPTDDTDTGYWERSGLRLHLDRGTGCEWLSTRAGDLSPRLDASGKQICRGAQ